MIRFKRGDQVRAVTDEGANPQIGTVVGSVIVGGQERVTVQPHGTIRSVIISADALRLVEDAPVRWPRLAGRIIEKKEAAQRAKAAARP